MGHGASAARRRMGESAPVPCIIAPMSATDSSIPYRTWMCVVCGFVYDEAEGLPEEGIEAGTRWADVPDTWTCPDCGVTKDDFEMVEL